MTNPGGTAQQFGTDDVDALDIIPEPATRTLLILGAAAFLWRTRARC